MGAEVAAVAAAEVETTTIITTTEAEVVVAVVAEVEITTITTTIIDEWMRIWVGQDILKYLWNIYWIFQFVFNRN